MAARLLALVASLVASACVERFVRIESDPPDAAIYLNGRYVGESPVEQPFVHSGTIRVDAWLASRPGVTEYFELETPWYERVPFDLFAELFDPRTHVDRQTFRIVVPAGPPLAGDEASKLRARAEELSAESR